METKAKLLSDSNEQTMSKTNVEEISEYIDENVHKTQYKIDHIRRLLQGSEFGNSAAESKKLVNSDNSQAMCVRLGVLREAAAHLLEHINSGHFNVDILKEMHGHIDDIDLQLNQFHENVQKTFLRIDCVERDTSLLLQSLQRSVQGILLTSVNMKNKNQMVPITRRKNL